MTLTPPFGSWGLKHLLPCLAGALLLATAAEFLAGPAAAQSCATIGSSTFCGARGSHNTVGNTVIFNNGPAGQRIGNFTVTGTPPRSQVLRGAESRGLAGPRTFSGVRPSIPLNSGLGSGGAYEARIAALRAEILAIEAQFRQEQLEQLNLTPAQDAAKQSMPPALIRALKLAQDARDEAAGKAAPGGAAAQ